MSKATENLQAIDALIEKLASETDAAAMSEQLTSYLSTAAKFHKYSLNNQLLIMCQMPTATRVASYKVWQSLGRQVRKGAKSIAILAPFFRKDEETGERKITGFGTVCVFDVSQTDGDPLPDMGWQDVDGDFSHLYATLVTVCQSQNISVTLEKLKPGLHGYSTGKGQIVVTTEDTSGGQVQTLLHEICHELCHLRAERTTFSKKQLECQAEAVSYCLCEALGVPAPNAPTYLALYGVDKAVLRANLDAIRTGVKRILDLVEDKNVEQELDSEVAA